MSEQPKRRLKFTIQMFECARCGGGHAGWWKSTPPPSCDERVKRGHKGVLLK